MEHTTFAAFCPRAIGALLLGALVSCGAGDGPAPAPSDTDRSAAAAAGEAPPLGETLEATSSRGSFIARVTPNTAEIPLNEPFGVMLEVVDAASGEPIHGADAITLDARMPAHRHGMLRDVELEKQGTGWAADGLLFHMVGHWELHVDVTRGAHTERAQIDVQLEF